MELSYLQELPNICSIFEIITRTGIYNKKLAMGFWESKLHSEILKSFPQSKEIMSFILSQQDIKCKSNTEFYTSNLWYFSMAQKSFQLFYFSLVDELVEVVQILLIFICIHDGTDRKPHNKLSI